ncbi:MAG TPA: MaoC/PaaZ C-terminal domain-containing protein [Solirubrobacteraceae bacterium]|jgi:acyl dehydratase
MATQSQQLRWTAPFGELELGQRFESDAKTVTESDVSVFCALTGDWHPQHWNAEWASRNGIFGERVAHGMLVLCLAVGLVPFEPERVRALRRVGDAVFKRPVRLGEQISLAGEIAALRPLDEQAGLVDLRLAIRNGEGMLVCRVSVQVLWAGGTDYWEQAVPGIADGFTPLPL